MNDDNKGSKIIDKTNFVMECFTLTQEILHEKINELNPQKYSFEEFIDMIMQYLKVSFIHNISLLVQTHNIMHGQGHSLFSELTDVLIKHHIEDIFIGFTELAKTSGEMFKNTSLH